MGRAGSGPQFHVNSGWGRVGRVMIIGPTSTEAEEKRTCTDRRMRVG